jgi:thioredoxin reductase
MKHSYLQASQGLLALSASFLLIACGSGNNITAPGNVGGTAVPLAATQDSGAAFNFIAMVVGKGEANAEEALVLSDATNDPVLATSETADPMPVAA